MASDEEMRAHLQRYQASYPAPARIARYVRAAESGLQQTITDEQRNSLKLVLRDAEQAQTALEDRDVDALLQAFERMVTGLAQAQMPLFHRAGVHEHQAGKTEGAQAAAAKLSGELYRLDDELGRQATPDEAWAAWRRLDGVKDLTTEKAIAYGGARPLKRKDVSSRLRDYRKDRKR